jgi:hypothetical protein
MAIAFDVAAGDAVATDDAVSSASFSIAATADRYSLGVIHNGDFATHATPVSLDVDSEDYTQLGATQEAFFGNCFGSFWTLVGPSSGSGKVLTGVVSEEESNLAAAAAFYTGVGGVGDSEVGATGNEGNDYTLSVTLDCEPGDVAAIAIAAVIGGGGAVTATGQASTTVRRVDQEGFVAAVLADKEASGSTVNLQVRFEHGGEITAVMWGAIVMQPSAGGSPIAQIVNHLKQQGIA